METSNVLTPAAPAPTRPFVPAILTPPKKTEKAHDKAPMKAKTAPTVVPDFTSPALGLFHRAREGRAIHRWETIIFVVMGISGLISILLAFL